MAASDERAGERAQLAAMRAAPDDAGLRWAYAEWLTEQGDRRGELLQLQEREEGHGAPLGLAELERLLERTAYDGFVRVPDDACADILPFTGGGSHPTQYDVDYGGHHYYLRWRYGFSIDVDDETVLECDLETLTSNDWTYRETTVMLAIVSEAIVAGRPLAELTFPDAAGFRAHPLYVVGKSPRYCLPEDFLGALGLAPTSLTLEVRDFARWHRLWDRRNQLRGAPSPTPLGPARCRCGVAGLSCGTLGCDLRR